MSVCVSVGKKCSFFGKFANIVYLQAPFVKTKYKEKNTLNTRLASDHPIPSHKVCLKCFQKGTT